MPEEPSEPDRERLTRLAAAAPAPLAEKIRATRLEGERSQLGGMMAQSKGKIAEIELQIIQIDQR